MLCGTPFDDVSEMTRVGRRLPCFFAALMLSMPANATAYSVLAHEAMIDAVWNNQLAPMLKQRFPGTSARALTDARAYAYGGALIQDLGYYPFGSRFFSNLVHYVRSGDFVEALVRDSQNVNEYAFALGALAHHAGDNLGHPIAVNRAVPIIYPKVGAKLGPEVLFADSPSRHVMVEFAFDVVEVARGTFKSDLYQNLVGFEVAMPVLTRAFRETYGLELRDVFGDTDLAVGTYRYAVSKIIPDMTRLAWREKRDEILAATPGVTEQNFVYSMTPRQYEDAFGTTYRKPGFVARFVVAIFKILPKFGPFKPLAFEPLTPETDQMFRESFSASRARYLAELRAARSGKLALGDIDLDTGRQSVRGANSLADETYGDLLKALAKRSFVDVPPALRHEINEHYASGNVQSTKKAIKQQRKAARLLGALNARSHDKTN
jgi:zinc dependent phospholipase C